MLFALPWSAEPFAKPLAVAGAPSGGLVRSSCAPGESGQVGRFVGEDWSIRTRRCRSCSHPTPPPPPPPWVEWRAAAGLSVGQRAGLAGEGDGGWRMEEGDGRGRNEGDSSSPHSPPPASPPAVAAAVVLPASVFFANAFAARHGRAAQLGHRAKCWKSEDIGRGGAGWTACHKSWKVASFSFPPFAAALRKALPRHTTWRSGSRWRAGTSGRPPTASCTTTVLRLSLLVEKLSRDSPLKVLLTDLPNLPTQLGRRTARPRSRRRMGRARPAPAAPAAPAAWTPAT